MWDTRSIELTVNLPVDVADDLEEVGKTDPDFFGKAIQYAIARRVVFDELINTLPPGLESGKRPGPGTSHD